MTLTGCIICKGYMSDDSRADIHRNCHYKLLAEIKRLKQELHSSELVIKMLHRAAAHRL